jgi:hypothetical protein
MAISTFDGWVGNVLLRAGDEYSDDHPLVKERPEMFEVEQEPEPEQEPEQGASVRKIRVSASTPVVAAGQSSRVKPGPKPGTSRTKP